VGRVWRQNLEKTSGGKRTVPSFFLLFDGDALAVSLSQKGKDVYGITHSAVKEVGHMLKFLSKRERVELGEKKTRPSGSHQLS